jgi:hypothetical protein
MTVTMAAIRLILRHQPTHAFLPVLWRQEA